MVQGRPEGRVPRCRLPIATLLLGHIRSRERRLRRPAGDGWSDGGRLRFRGERQRARLQERAHLSPTPLSFIRPDGTGYREILPPGLCCLTRPSLSRRHQGGVFSPPGRAGRQRPRLRDLRQLDGWQWRPDRRQQQPGRGLVTGLVAGRGQDRLRGRRSRGVSAPGGSTSSTRMAPARSRSRPPIWPWGSRHGRRMGPGSRSPLRWATINTSSSPTRTAAAAPTSPRTFRHRCRAGRRRSHL